MKSFFTLTLLFIILLLGKHTFAQQQDCTNCTFDLSGSGNYSLASGQKACILSGTTFNGNIIMNGGTLVNCGTLAPASISFYGGTIINNDSSYFQSLTFNGPNTVVRNYGNMIFSTVTFAGGALYNESTLLVNTNFLVYTAVAHFQNSGTLTVMGDLTNYASNVINSGTLNITGTYHNNYSCTLENTGQVTIGNNYSDIGTFNNKGVTTVANNAQINGGAFFIAGPGSEFSTKTLSIIGHLTGDVNQCSLLKIGTSVTSNWGAVISGKINVCTQGTVTFAPQTQGPNVILSCDCISSEPADYLNDFASFAVIAGNTLHSPNTIVRGNAAYQTLSGTFKGTLPSFHVVGPGNELNLLKNKLSLTTAYYANTTGTTISSSDLLNNGLSTPGIYHINGNLNLSHTTLTIGNEDRYVVVVHGNLTASHVVLNSSNYTKNIVWIVLGTVNIDSDKFGGTVLANSNITLGADAQGNLSLFSLSNVTNTSIGASLTASTRNLRTSALDYLLIVSFNPAGTYGATSFQTDLYEQLDGMPTNGGANFRYNLKADLINITSSASTSAFNENISYYMATYPSKNVRSNLEDVNCTLCSGAGNNPCNTTNSLEIPSYNGYKITHTLSAPRASTCDQFLLTYSLNNINYDYLSMEIGYTLVVGTGNYSTNPGGFKEYYLSSSQPCNSTYTGTISGTLTYQNSGIVNITGYDYIISDQVLTGGKTFEDGKSYAFLNDVEFTNGIYYVPSGTKLSFASGQTVNDCNTPPYYTCCTFKPIGITLREATLVSNGGTFDAVSGTPYWKGITLDNTSNVNLLLSGATIKKANTGISLQRLSNNPSIQIQGFFIAGSSFIDMRNGGISLLDYTWDNSVPIVNPALSKISGNVFTGILNPTFITTGIDMGHSNLSNVLLASNVISNFHTGIVSRGTITASSNALSNIIDRGIEIEGSNSVISGNTITMAVNTANPNSGHVGLFITGKNMTCNDNTVNGVYATSRRPMQYGALISTDGASMPTVFKNNRITNFGVGALLYNIDGAGVDLSGNYYKAVTGIRKDFWFYNLPAPVNMQCNTFDAMVLPGLERTGIRVTTGARLQDIGSPTQACGNRFINCNPGVRNENTDPEYAVNYWNASNEIVTFNENVNLNLTGLLANCSGKGYSTGIARLAQNDYAIDINALQDTLQYQWTNPVRLKTIQRELVDYYAVTNDWEGLRAYSDRLLHCNREAYYTFYLFLYSKTGEPNFPYTPEEIEQALLLPDAHDAEIKSRILYRQWQQRASQVSGLSHSDSSALGYMAGSGSSLAALACMHLQKHYNNYSCPVAVSTYQAQVQGACPSPLMRTGADHDVQGRTKLLSLARPNPATEQTFIQYQTKGQEAQLLFTSLTDGRLVKEMELNPENHEVLIHLQDFQAGVYAYTLYIQGVAQATERLVVIKQ